MSDPQSENFGVTKVEDVQADHRSLRRVRPGSPDHGDQDDAVAAEVSSLSLLYLVTGTGNPSYKLETPVRL
jgi:hypothetical protein